jgi:hypothetical protein
MPPIGTEETITTPDSQPATQNTAIQDAAGADSSTATQNTQNTHDEAVADSSAAKAQGADAPAPKTSLEAVMAAMQSQRDAKAGAVAGSETSPDSDDGKAGDKPPTEAENKAPTDPDAPPVNMRPENREHWSRLVAEKNAFKERAQNFDNLSTWVQNNGLDYEQVISGLTIMSLIQNDPIKALEAVKPIYEKLQKEAGAVLPDDLQQRIEDGRIDEESARELARQRAEAQHAARRVTVQADQMQAQQSQQLLHNIQSAVVSFEAQWKATDPDFPALHPSVVDRVGALIREEGAPQNADEAVAQVKRAIGQVRERMRKHIPEKREIKPVTNGSGGKDPGTRQIKSSIDAAMAALGR